MSAPTQKPAPSNLAKGVPAGVPPMKLEVLVYSDTPGERFVFINGRKYVEGQAVDGGATLERIDQDGAVLSHGGRRFVLRE